MLNTFDFKKTDNCWGRMEEGMVREFGMDAYTLVYLKWMNNKDPLYSTWNSVQCYVAAWMGVGFGGEWITCICMAESLHSSPETTTLLIGYTPIQHKKCKVF